MTHHRTGIARRMALALTTLVLAVPAVAAAESGLEKKSRKAFEEMKQRIPISAHERATQIVECVTYSLIAVLDDSDAQQNWEVVLFEDDNINAFALAGGKVGVNTGIFKVADNPDALAAVIGHEIAHVMEQHVAKRATRKVLTQIGAVAAAVGAGIAGAPGVTQQATANAASLGAELGINKPYDRAQETDADIVGMHYMARAGFDPRATIDLWKNMTKANRGSPPEFLSTHPSSDNRLARLAEELPSAIAEYDESRAAGRQPDCH
jgi:predicted Zn-dependent protease